MDHAYIDANAVADRYVMGDLPPSERELFEVHAIECEACQRAIEASRGLREGFRAGGDTGTVLAPPPLAIPRARPLAWMAAGLLMAALPGAWFAARSVRLQQELERQQSSAVRPREPVLGADEALRAYPVYVLNVVRAGRPQPPTVTVPVGAQAQPVLFELENPQAPEFVDYQVAITDTKGSAVLSGTALRQTAADHLAIVISPNSIAPGDYKLTLSGRTRDQRYVPVAEFSFRTARANP